MKVRNLKYLRKKFFLAYGDEGGDGGTAGGAGTGGAGTGGAGTGGAGAAGSTPPAKSFTQTDVDAIINKRFAKEKSEKEALIAQLENFKQSAGLSAKEKEDLSKQIEDMQNSLLTKDQQAANEKKNLEKKWSEENKKAKEEIENWKNRFTRSTTIRALKDAERSVGVQEEGQLVLMFENRTRLEEEKDDEGKPTGDFIAKLKFDAKDEEGKKITFDLPVEEAFMKMRELGLHKNIFKHEAKPGTGENNGSGKGGKNSDPSKMPEPDDYKTSAEYNNAYQKWRDEYNPDGSRRVVRK